MNLLSNFLKNSIKDFHKIFHLYFYSNRSFIFDKKKKMLFNNFLKNVF